MKRNFLIGHNVFVYGKLRVCVRGFSIGKSDVANVQRPLIKHNIAIFYIRCYPTFFIFNSQLFRRCVFLSDIH